MERIKALQEAIAIIDLARAATSESLPAVREFLATVRKYLEDEQKVAFSETFDLAA